jgi:hypothetical protein
MEACEHSFGARTDGREGVLNGMNDGKRETHLGHLSATLFFLFTDPCTHTSVPRHSAEARAPPR